MHPLYVHVLGWIILKIPGSMMGVMTSGHLECDVMTLGHPCEGRKGKRSFRVPSPPSLLHPTPGDGQDTLKGRQGRKGTGQGPQRGRSLLKRSE